MKNKLCLGCFLEDKMEGDHLCRDCLIDVWESQETFIDENEVKNEWKTKEIKR